jgi:hypothetical protein
MIQTQKLWGNPDSKKQNAMIPNSARVRPESISRGNRGKLFGAQSLTRPTSRDNSKFRNEKSRFNQTMKGPQDKKLNCMGSSSTQNLHKNQSIKLQKYDDFLGTAHHHHQSVQLPVSDKYRSQVVSTFSSQNRVDANPIGPQKTKS